MPTIKPEKIEEGYWVKVKDGEVLQVWNTQPDQDELDSGLWTAAVEVFPEYTPGREEISGHTIDVTQSPIKIIYGKVNVELSDRVDVHKYRIQQFYKGVILEESEKAIGEIPSDPDMTRITGAKSRMEAVHSSLDAVTTHDELDEVDLTFSV